MQNKLVTPIYKSGGRTNCGNYRPISIISVVAKILGKTIYNQIFDFLKQNSILADQQSGFGPFYSTETTLIHSANQCPINMDRGLINKEYYMKFISSVEQDISRVSEANEWDILLSTRNKENLNFYCCKQNIDKRSGIVK